MGLCLHEGDSQAKSVLDAFMVELTKCVSNSTSLFAVTSDTTGNMNRFGILLESLKVMHPYCTDHVVACSCKLLYDDKTYKDTGLNDLGDPAACVKRARKLVQHFSKSTQAMEKLKAVQKFWNADKLMYPLPDYIAVEEDNLFADMPELVPREGGGVQIPCLSDNVGDPMFRPRSGAPLKLLQDVKTRWWSTYRMINRLLELKSSVVRVSQSMGENGDNNPQYVECDHYLTDHQWNLLEALNYVLHAIYKCMKLVEGDRYVTASWVPVQIEMVRKRLWEGSQDQYTKPSKRGGPGTVIKNPPLVQKICKPILEDIEHRWKVGNNTKIWNDGVRRGFMNRQEGIHPCFIIAMCLDPRFKELKTAETGVKDVEREDIWKKVFELMVQEKSSVRTNNKNNTTTIGEEDNMEDNTGNNEGQAANVDDGNGNNLSEDLISSLFDEDDDFNAPPPPAAFLDQANNASSNNTIEEVCELELRLYRKEDTVPKFYRKADSDKIIWTNILGWWQLKEGAYPTLASLAKKFLAIEATSAASERLFSTAGRVITRDRNRLDPNTVGQILYVKSNLDWYETYLKEHRFDEILNIKY